MSSPGDLGKRALGMQLEALAARYLAQQGLSLVCRNFQCKLGEIDLVMRDRNTLVFVEVRFRRSSTHGSACATVDWRKQRKVRRAAQVYLQRSGLQDRLPCRFDVLGITREPVIGTLQFDWVRAAFTLDAP
jgi:putative endonuclease